MNLNRYIWFGLDSCLYCGSLFPKNGQLCQHCEDLLFEGVSRDLLHLQILHDLPIWSLFFWIPGKQEILSQLILNLKGENKSPLWQFYAEEFYRRRLLSFRDQRLKPWVFVPCPGKSLDSQDHAHTMARCLSELTACPLLHPLRRAQEEGAQRDKGRQTRFKRRFEWREDFTEQRFRELTQHKHVVFVDDIVTTGATALAAWKILGKPAHFSVWSLAYRASLAERPGI